MSNFNVNYQLNTKINSTSQSEELIAITPNHHAEPLSQQHLLLSHTKKQQSMVLAIYLSTVIDVLKSYRTLNEHIAEIKSFMGLDASATQDIRAVIQQLQEQGFIVSAKESQQEIASTHSKPLQEPPVVIVRTANRVTMLKRFLQSAVENEQRYHARYCYLIIDDSQPELSEANCINIENSGLNAEHVDEAQQRIIIDKYKEQHPNDANAIEFLLGQHDLHASQITYGRTWNWGMLLSAGKPVVFLDDDCVLEAYASPIEQKQTITLGTLNQEVVFLEKEKSLSEQLQRVNIDPIAQLAQNLGLNPTQYPVDEASFAGADYRCSDAFKNAHVKIVSPAVAGDPGSDNPKWLYYLQGESAKRFWGNNENEFQRHQSERFAWVGESSQHFSLGNQYSVVARAFDNRELLPPTLPILRNEDALFTNLLHYLYPTAASTNVQWAIAHLPEIERKWNESLESSADSFDIVKALDDFVAPEHTRLSNNETAKNRLLDLSRQLELCAKQNEESFKQWMYTHQQSSRAATVRALQATMATNANAPDYWHAAISEIVNANIGSDQSLNIFYDLTVEKIQHLLLAFAQSFTVWEKLWQAEVNQRSVDG